MEIKAAFFDIDSTLYDHGSHRFIESSITALKELHKRGVKIFINTARPYHSAERFGIFNYGIPWDGGVFSAGSTVFIKSKLLYTERFSYRRGIEFINFAKKHGYVVELVGCRRRSLSDNPNEYVNKYREVFKDQFSRKRRYDGKPITCFLLYAPKEADELFQKEFPEIYYFRFNDYGVDCKSFPYNKGHGIRKILEKYNIDKSNTIAFGDGIQDLKVKPEVGAFIAVGNASDEVKKDATFVCDNIVDDGIYKFLKENKLI